MIRTIFFDLDGTLFDRASAHRRYCLDLIKRRPDAFPGGREDAALLDLTRGSDDLDWDRRAFGRRIADRFPALGMTGADVARDHAAGIAGFVEPDPHVVRLLTRLAGRYRLAIVSNGSGPVQRAKLARLGLGKSAVKVFISGEIGAAKPDPAVFRTVLAWADCPASESLFVGDDPSTDIAGAAGVGIPTCWVSRGRPYTNGQPAADRTIFRVADLAEVVG